MLLAAPLLVAAAGFVGPTPTLVHAPAPALVIRRAPARAPLLVAVAAGGPSPWLPPAAGPLTEDSSRERYSVLAVLAAAFLNLLGFTMTIPITPVLKQHFSLQVGASFGMLTSAYPLGMMVGLALWPNLSDRVGRRPVMSLSLFGNFVGLVLQGMALLRQWPLPALQPAENAAPDLRTQPTGLPGTSEGGPLLRTPERRLISSSRLAVVSVAHLRVPQR